MPYAISLLSPLYGVVVGLSLGLTGGGGAIFAVPLLVYGLGLAPREAVGVSLASVGMTAFVGFLHRWHLRQVDIGTGLLFAAAGMVGAPVGTWIAGRLPEPLLLTLFAGLMTVVALRMWQQASSVPTQGLPSANEAVGGESHPSGFCQRDTEGALRFHSRCVALLVLLGLATGLLSGLFGVGGGFVIVPALVLFSGMPIHRAVGTSLLVIALVSVSGVSSYLWSGRPIAPEITGLFVLGGVGGMFAGQRISRRLSGPVLQKLFVVAILAVAMFIILRNLSVMWGGV